MTEGNARRRVAVIGGGAGGLAAAVAAGGADAEVIILEKANRVGKKLLKTGNGRCNLSNRHVSSEGYNRPGFVAPLLGTFGCDALVDFFASIGLWTVTDGEGRVYPRSDTAASVLDVLRLAAAERASGRSAPRRPPPSKGTAGGSLCAPGRAANSRPTG